MTGEEPHPPEEPRNTEHEDRLLWRSALGQATYDLLADGREVTPRALIDRLREDEAATISRLRGKAVRAALAVLQEIGT